MLSRFALSFVLFCVGPFSICLADSAIHFDLPATAAATDVTPEGFGHDGRLVSIPLNLSLIVDSLPTPTIDQLVVQIKPLGGTATVADYLPRTELSSRYATDIEVCHSKEVLEHAGLSIDGAYGPLARANVGLDRNEKNIDSTKFSRVAPMHIVASSGTTHRGRGVYFKLRADERQVLEGDKQFIVVLRVPSAWRGELVEVRVEAEALTKTFVSSFSSFTGVMPKSQVVGDARFLVATHIDVDHEMAALANRIADTELRMRELGGKAQRETLRHKTSRPDYAAFRFDLSAPDQAFKQESIARVVNEAIFGRIDPYHDPVVSRLPLDTRVAILDFLEAREDYLARSATR
jgi:hypothetical protein